jgi:ribosomal protein S18 acetylase RimI-like enzyme
MLNFNPAQMEIEFIRNALTQYNKEVAEGENHKEYNIIHYDNNGKIIAGLLGGTYWGWLYIDILWIDKNHRFQGLGTKLVLEAEKEALSRGCEYAHLDTMSFQALNFYKKLGYKVKTIIKNIPKGHKKYIMIKKLKK